MLWCQPNNIFMKISNFVNIFKPQKISFVLHQSATYENSHRMTTSEVMLWCQPNDKLVKIANYVKL